MMRTSAFVGQCGFREDLIAGEEPELCVRFRAAGWRVWRCDHGMALHDAAMTRFAQWWMRTLRAGYSYAQAVHLHGAPPERHGVRESRSVWAWGLGLPLLVAGFVAAFGASGFLLLLAYPFQIVRLGLSGRRTRRENWWRATFLVVGKFPELVGQLKFLFHLVQGSRAQLIEHRK